MRIMPLKFEQDEIDEFPYVPPLAKNRKTYPAKKPMPRTMALDGKTAEAIRIYKCLMGASWASTAREFGCTKNAVVDIVNGKYHNGRKRGQACGQK